MELRMKNFSILDIHWKIQLLRGGGGELKKKQYRGEDCLKRGASTVWKFKEGRGTWQEREGGVFEGGC